MSSQFSISPEPDGSPIEVSQSSQAYREARKNCLFFSAWLAFSATFGITVDMKAKWGIELPSATVRLLVLSCLVLFFYNEMGINWRQLGIKQKRLLAENYRFAQAITFAALVIAVVRYVTRSEVIKLLSRPFSSHSTVTIEDILLLGIAAFVCVTVGGLREWKTLCWLKRTITVLSIPVSLYLIVLLLGVIPGPWRYWATVAASIIGALLAFYSQILLSRSGTIEHPS